MSITQIEQQLRQLPPEKLAVVYDFISYLLQRQLRSEAFETLLASEEVSRRDWERQEEDAAWADLQARLTPIYDLTP